MAKPRNEVRPGWIGRPITASITGFTVDDTVAGCRIELRIQTTLSDEFCNYLPPWVTAALHDNAENMTLQLGERELGLEFSLASDPGTIAMRLEAIRLQARMRIFQRQDGWHARILVEVPWNERLAAFAGNQLLAALHMRFFDLESEQRAMFSPGTEALIHETADALAEAGVTDIEFNSGGKTTRATLRRKPRERKDLDS